MMPKKRHVIREEVQDEMMLVICHNPLNDSTFHPRSQAKYWTLSHVVIDEVLLTELSDDEQSRTLHNRLPFASCLFVYV